MFYCVSSSSTSINILSHVMYTCSHSYSHILRLCIEGDIESLVAEARCIQARINSRIKPTNEEEIARRFAKLMMIGKVNAALQLLSRKTTGSVLNIDKLISSGSNQQTVLETLKQLHPPAAIANEECLLNEPMPNARPYDPIIFDNLDGNQIKCAALKCKGAAGPTGTDAHAWRRLCSSFKQASNDLCNALANVGRRICTQPLDSEGLAAFVACRLIPLDKCPGIRPIGIGEVPRRIVSKAVMSIVHDDVITSAGPLQVCAGQEGGAEAAAHAMRHVFDSSEEMGVLLVDATNAFNSLNRTTALLNMKFICPSLEIILNNTYQSPIRMFLPGGEEILSHEGTTQGDPLGMAMYALAITPIIAKLNHHHKEISQVWFADDATGSGTCEDLRAWWDELIKIGPKFGYHPNAIKTHLVVKEGTEDKAKAIFMETSVNITTRGKRHLGAAIGSSNFCDEYVRSKVSQWTDELMLLTKFAKSQPHASFAAFTHGLSRKWSHLSRTMANTAELLQPLEEVIHQHFIPALTGRPPVSSFERKLLALPARMGGLGITNPVADAEHEYQSSRKVTTPLVDLIIQQDLSKPMNIDLSREKLEIKKSRRESQQAISRDITTSLSLDSHRLMQCASERGASAWVTAIPYDVHGFFLHKGAFRDALCLRYGWGLSGIPNKCCCGNIFSIDHAMSCHRGGFPTLRHNEVRDITANLLSEVRPNTCIEPVLQPLNGEIFQHRTANLQSEARVDIRTNGFWSRGQEAFFDVRVFHPNASSYRTKDLAALYSLHEGSKKREYGERIREVEHGVFTPLVLSTTGGMAHEATTFYKKLAADVAVKRNLQYSTVISWLRCRLSFALLRSAIVCKRIPKHHYRSYERHRYPSGQQGRWSLTKLIYVTFI